MIPDPASSTSPGTVRSRSVHGRESLVSLNRAGILSTMPGRIHDVASSAELRGALGMPPSTGSAVLLVGGADVTAAADLEPIRAFLGTVVSLAERFRMAVVDGGTDSGVMRLIGEARKIRGASFPLVGVVPRGALERTTRSGRPIRIAPGHSDILLVPGSEFGDEIEWLFAAADHLGAGRAPTLVVNGGHMTMVEARMRIDQGQVVVAVEGSGRAADELAADADLRASGRLRVIDLDADEQTLAAILAPATDRRAEETIETEGRPT
jgi:hypothetical protein